MQIRANLRIIRGMGSKKVGGIPTNSKSRQPGIRQGQHGGAGATYDPRRKSLDEELEGLEEGLSEVAVVAITELGVLERATLRLISAERLMEKRWVARVC